VASTMTPVDVRRPDKIRNNEYSRLANEHRLLSRLCWETPVAINCVVSTWVPRVVWRGCTLASSCRRRTTMIMAVLNILVMMMRMIDCLVDYWLFDEPYDKRTVWFFVSICTLQKKSKNIFCFFNLLFFFKKKIILLQHEHHFHPI